MRPGRQCGADIEFWLSGQSGEQQVSCGQRGWTATMRSQEAS
jgi:hypothetical protein